MATSNAIVGLNRRADGSEHVLRTGKDSELIIAAAHGTLYEAAYRGRLFYSYCAAKTLVASNTTYTGHAIWNSSNQTGNGVNLVVKKIACIVTATSASMTGIALAFSSGQTVVPSGTTAATLAGSCLLSSGAGSGLSYSAATLSVAGTSFLPLVHNTAAINTVGTDSYGIVDLDGAIIVPPGYVLQLLALGAASAASAVTSSIIWEEVPV